MSAKHAKPRVGEVELLDAQTFSMDLHESRTSSAVQWFFRQTSRLPVAMNMMTLPPGAWEGTHIHEGEFELEEIYLVVCGTAEGNMGDEAFSLGPGDAVLAPAGVAHGMRNTGDDELRILVIWGPEGQRDQMLIHDSRLSIVRAAARNRLNTR